MQTTENPLFLRQNQQEELQTQVITPKHGYFGIKSAKQMRKYLNSNKKTGQFTNVTRNVTKETKEGKYERRSEQAKVKQSEIEKQISIKN